MADIWGRNLAGFNDRGNYLCRWGVHGMISATFRRTRGRPSFRPIIEVLYLDDRIGIIAL